jgi:ankyrin repeat protein
MGRDSEWLRFCSIAGAAGLLMAALLVMNAERKYVNARHAQDNLLEAVDSGSTSRVREALRNADVNGRDSSGLTALASAARSGRAEIVSDLLSAGADVDRASASFGTPLVGAAANGHEQVVEMLLRAGAEVDARDYRGNTGLWYAAAHANVPMIDRLLAAGADVNVSCLDQSTPLIAAAAAEDNAPAAIRRLLRAGADPFAVDQDGRTAFDTARRVGSERAAELLRSARQFARYVD